VKRFILLALVMVLAIPFAFSTTPKAEAGDDANAIYWNAEYYDNPYLIGPAKLLRQDRGINYNWGTQVPATGLPADNFSVRWTARPTFDAGKYRFYMTADDAANVTIDFSVHIISSISSPKPGQTYTADVTMSAGQHHVQIDYQESIGNAYINFYWQKLDSTGNPTTPTGPSGVPTLPSDRPAAYINSYILNVRYGPGINFDVITTQTRYSIVQLLGRNADATWVKVRLSNGIEGWMSSTYLVGNVAFGSLPLIDASGNQIPTTPPPAGSGTGTVITGRLNVRYGPGINFGVFTVAINGQNLTLIARNSGNSWLKVKLADGRIGWVSAAYIRVNGDINQLPIATS